MADVNLDQVVAFDGFRFQVQLAGEYFDGLLVAVGFLAALTVSHWFRWLGRRLFPPPKITPYFSPRGGCAKAIIAELQKAKSEVLVQAYSFTFDPIVDALVAAHKRGVKVEVLLDRDNEHETYSDLVRIQGYGLEVKIDADHAIAHNKIMIIDRRVLITGSFNFTKQAEMENAENILIIENHRELLARYLHSFGEHRGHCRVPNPKAESGTADKGKKAA